MNFQPRRWFSFVLIFLPCAAFAAGYALENASPADAALNAYFERETHAVEEKCLAGIRTLEDWKGKRDVYRQQLFEMLSLSPLPSKTDLKPVVTGKVDHEAFTVENLHFQSLPGLYVTANLYLPKGQTKPAPTILYVCGHGPVITNGISYGNKVTYQHHGAWLARNGYVCMILDSLQLGEIQGLHHGTHREGMWWWNSRGYTPAGVEAWNCIRALDYLETRSEVDASRFGVTGRSGGGAYSWWVSALDDRIKATAPVAGITDLHNHVVDGVVEGHCDCMFIVNTYRWDYALVAALVAPRPLMIANTDSDGIFPLDGVVRLHADVRRIYELHNAAPKVALLITGGPHKDTQDLQLPVLRWFNRHLKGEEPPIETAARPMFTPQQLRVFDQLPTDALNTNIHFSFVRQAQPPTPPVSKGEWTQLKDGWLDDLRQKSFAGWPSIKQAPNARLESSFERAGLRFQNFTFESQPHVALKLQLVQPGGDPDSLVLKVVETEISDVEQTYKAWKVAHPESRAAVAFFAPRGPGANGWSATAKKQVQIQRRFMLLGQTLDGMRVWDIRRAAQALSGLHNAKSVWLEAEGAMAVNAVYARLFESRSLGLKLNGLPRSHMDGPDYLNVLRILDIPQALAIAADLGPVRIDAPESWAWPTALAKNLGWSADRFGAHSR